MHLNNINRIIIYQNFQNYKWRNSHLTKISFIREKIQKSFDQNSMPQISKSTHQKIGKDCDRLILKFAP